MIFQNIGRWLKTISNSGAFYAPDDQIKRKVVLSNQLTLSIIGLSIPLLFLCVLIIKQNLITYITVVIAFSTLVVPYLNQRGYINFTRTAFCLAAILTAEIVPLISKIYYPEGIGINMYYSTRFALLAFLAFPLLLIDLRERKALIICLLIHTVFFLGFDLIDNFFGVGFYQVNYKTGMYYNFSFYAIIYFVFLLSALFYLQFNNQDFEFEIESLNKSLDKRVKQKTKELENSNINLEAFNYMISHELKTPLTAAQMLSGTFMAKYEKQIDEHGVEQLLTINRCMEEMQNLIKSILTFSRLTSQVESISAINMTELVNEVIEEIKLNVDFGSTKIKIAELPVTKGDRALMKQVWVNLLSNAVKYSKYETERIIEIGGREEGSDTVYYVKDNGIGFPAEDNGKLFELFGRLHSKAKFEGTGVGLAIVKRIILLHGGRIWAEGKPEEGAVFYFSLPSKA